VLAGAGCGSDGAVIPSGGEFVTSPDDARSNPNANPAMDVEGGSEGDTESDPVRKESADSETELANADSDELARSLPDGASDTASAPVSPAAELPPVESRARSEFDIELVFDAADELPELVIEAFDAAKQRWQSVIIGDLPDVEMGFEKAACEGHRLPGFIDDVVIFVSTPQIDGPEGVLGSAGPCVLRDDDLGLPFAGLMYFDVDDLVYFGERGRLEEIVLHEMGHVLGIGSLWPLHDLLDDPATGRGPTPDTSFLGAHAIEQFDAVGGLDYDGNKVPVENEGEAAVANGHWRESVFGNELMTPYLSDSATRLSAITIASLQDLGYVVSYAGADAYAWPPEPDSGADWAGDPGRFFSGEIPLHADVYQGPVHVVRAGGELWRLR